MYIDAAGPKNNIQSASDDIVTYESSDKLVSENTNLSNTEFEETTSEPEIEEEIESPEISVPDIIKPNKPQKPNLPQEPKPITPKPKPDIITDIKVKLYNNKEEGFNKVDGREYIEDIYKYVNQYAPEGMLKSVACAMAYTEGGSGKQGVYVCSNNCFGIMATSAWEGMVYSRTTGKVYKDYETARKYGADGLFRAYDCMEDSVKDYIRLMSGSYYGEVLKITDHATYIQYILDKGYGEPHLKGMWLSLIDMYDLKQYD